jgi:hypothetical protein
MNFQGTSNSQQNINCCDFIAALNLPHVYGVNVNSFGQFFLSQTSRFSIFPNTISQKFSIFFCDHDWALSQTAAVKMRQILLAIIFRLDSRPQKSKVAAGMNWQASEAAWHSGKSLFPRIEIFCHFPITERHPEDET